MRNINDIAIVIDIEVHQSILLNILYPALFIFFDNDYCFSLLFKYCVQYSNFDCSIKNSQRMWIVL